MLISEGMRNRLWHAMEENAERTLTRLFEVKRTMEEGENVVVHSHVRQNPDDIGVIVVHIFRFQMENRRTMGHRATNSRELSQ